MPGFLVTITIPVDIAHDVDQLHADQKDAERSVQGQAGGSMVPTQEDFSSTD